MLLTFSDLAQFYSFYAASQKIESSQIRTVTHFQMPINHKLQLAIRQRQLHLPIDAILASDPMLNRLVNQVLTHIPALVTHNRIELEQSIYASITVDSAPITIEGCANVDSSDAPHLYDWAIRSPDLMWRDQVKLWSAVKHFDCEPDAVSFTAVALRFEAEPIVQHYQWSRSFHEQTEAWLTDLIEASGMPIDQSIPHQNSIHDLKAFIDEIPEVEI